MDFGKGLVFPKSGPTRGKSKFPDSPGSNASYIKIWFNIYVEVVNGFGFSDIKFS